MLSPTSGNSPVNIVGSVSHSTIGVAVEYGPDVHAAIAMVNGIA
jgi:hypothetical protein